MSAVRTAIKRLLPLWSRALGLRLAQRVFDALGLGAI